MFILFRLIFSPTRQLAKVLRRRKILESFSSIMWWNALFYLFAFGIFAIAISDLRFFGEYQWRLFYFSLAICLWRVNELISAFYGEIFSKKVGSEQRLPISSEERIILLTFAYVESIFQFAIAYYSIFRIFGSKAFGGDFKSIFDALYLSGMTITTTGFGDIVPVSPWSRAVAVYEALTGLVLIAIALAAYLGDRDDDTKQENRAESRNV